MAGRKALTSYDHSQPEPWAASPANVYIDVRGQRDGVEADCIPLLRLPEWRYRRIDGFEGGRVEYAKRCRKGMEGGTVQARIRAVREGPLPNAPIRRRADGQAAAGG